MVWRLKTVHLTAITHGIAATPLRRERVKSSRILPAVRKDTSPAEVERVQIMRTVLSVLVTVLLLVKPALASAACADLTKLSGPTATITADVVAPGGFKAGAGGVTAAY